MFNGTEEHVLCCVVNVLLDVSVLSDVSGLREEVLTVLEHALLGDRLAAEFLLCHLASSM